ncbi:MAG: LysM peptidoglycan-binding domain-containing protein [Firmicutes bacterium]|nr:LysM peptidoglycan-binding domain-containing protein [Bacillota bacterium]
MMERYRVQRGDTLWLIAQRFYGDPTAYTLIAQANGLSDPHRLVAGQELLLPPLDGERPGRK